MMDELSEMILATATRVFADRVTPAVLNAAEGGGLDAPLWEEITSAGLSSATLPEAEGGISLPLGSALTLARAAGEHAVPAPLIEALIAGRVLAAAGLSPPAGVVTIGPVLPGDRLQLAREDGDWTVSGQLRRLPWGRHAVAAVVIAGEGSERRTIVVDRPAKVLEDRNWADEPRDTWVFEAQPLAAGRIGPIGRGYDIEALRFDGALFRAAQMVGALDRVLEISLQHARDRVQFGRPIAGFQAVQQQLAELASQVAAAAAALDAAAAAPGGFECAAAKVRIGEAAGEAAAIAHRICAAMGFSHEFPLHRFTRRLWSWRDEFGSEEHWSEWLGRIVVARGGDGFWPLLTDQPGVLPAGVR